MKLCKEGCGRPTKSQRATMCVECLRVYEKGRRDAMTARMQAWRKKARVKGVLPLFKLRQGE